MAYFSASGSDKKDNDVWINSCHLGYQNVRCSLTINTTDINEVEVFNNGSSKYATQTQIKVYLNGSSTASYTINGGAPSQIIDTTNVTEVKIDQGWGYTIPFTVRLKNPNTVSLHTYGLEHDDNGWYIDKYNCVNVKGFKRVTIQNPSTYMTVVVRFNGARYYREIVVPKNSTQFIDINDGDYSMMFLQNIPYTTGDIYVTMER